MMLYLAGVKQLSGSEVTELYNSGTPIDANTHSASANIQAYWRMGNDEFDDGTGTTGKIMDRAGHLTQHQQTLSLGILQLTHLNMKYSILTDIEMAQFNGSPNKAETVRYNKLGTSFIVKYADDKIPEGLGNGYTQSEILELITPENRLVRCRHIICQNQMRHLKKC